MTDHVLVLQEGLTNHVEKKMEIKTGKPLPMLKEEITRQTVTKQWLIGETAISWHIPVAHSCK